MDSLELTQKLITFESTSRSSNVAVTDFVSEQLEQIGFVTERINYDDLFGVPKSCVVAKKGEGFGGLGFFAHNDVVPADPWYVDFPGPFEPTILDGKLYGRGSCDMKGSLACMLSAAATVEAAELKQPVYITCTADEEVGYIGAKNVAAQSHLYREMVEHGTKGIIGEPTMLEVIHAHKGTFGFRAISRGVAAHSSTNKGVNANLKMIPFLSEMKCIHDETLEDPRWQNDEFSPPTISWNIGINDKTLACNITPPQSICTVYFRPMPGMDGMELIERVRQLAEVHDLEFHADAINSSFYVEPQSDFIQQMLKLAGKSESHTVSYGTDGAAFHELTEKVVFGPGDIMKAHTHDEWITLEQLELGHAMFSKLIDHWCLQAN
ncbi:Acetylornithine deacetylase [Polystyrenella longa]|uniref:Acetylornithine deacetylase n=1 Tax=Polystyrenella longa TaxID=2528007 RepID=A0A518CRG3_9PLAN|nr:M20 family metallopeptidase [Polystyrenella longa]QDU81821.1 Acetylornithine deacetylase [Polystyrenella longa]